MNKENLPNKTHEESEDIIRRLRRIKKYAYLLGAATIIGGALAFFSLALALCFLGLSIVLVSLIMWEMVIIIKAQAVLNCALAEIVTPPPDSGDPGTGEKQ